MKRLSALICILYSCVSVWADGTGNGFHEERLVFYGKDSLRYGATLTLPDAPGRHTAVVIASGSYPQDRDGTMAGHKIYKEFADCLGKHGIAVLRVDDRGVGESGGIYEDKTSRLMKGTDTLSLPPIHHLRTDGAIFVTGWSPSGHEPSSLP